MTIGSVKPSTPRAFKGIAVFTPGGDLAYCCDYDKRNQWHLSLCGALQEHLGLLESPHFLVPYFTATVDYCVNVNTSEVQIFAETYPLVYPYQGLLNVLFGLGNLEWQRVMPKLEYRSCLILETYRSRFPQLWENHDLILDISNQLSSSKGDIEQPTAEAESSGPVLRLFVSGHSALTEHILKTLQAVLESSRYQPYTLQMIDVSKHPEQAEIDQVSATPTLVRVAPKPIRRLVGELDNPRAILSLLDEN